MIPGIIWRVLLIAIALVFAGVQLDREAGKTYPLAASVPEQFRSASQFPMAAMALDSDNPDYTLAEAERLIRRRPLPAEHLRILAQAQFAAGATDESALTIQYAAQRGWREPLAQETMARLAIDAGDMPEAARRYAALFLRRDTQDALLEELGPMVLSEPGGAGRQTLIEIVGGGDRWHNQFLRRGARVMPADAFVEIVSATVANGSRYDCDLLNQLERGLTTRDEAAGEGLKTVIADQCPS
ncbi:hypothetical protein [Sulfitobacter sp.]|uniref:hypothetical protein n=1 Tax=Sulfitobacter sp. TaxID=1903071 RepID=UPI003EF4A19E